MDRWICPISRNLQQEEKYGAKTLFIDCCNDSSENTRFCCTSRSIKDISKEE
ncbi:hypothetical protein KIN20_008344 [Parelaphostrongylus tenuis]|uniref:Uncharacterized protein n=1 Tax=Parelaphostrongylus tenuis TaxID=148309 RepID=A0AAD5M4P2_PARTN|nr:hypothetical protein KIN20_008344 [Parelaphostrongylus tenuis]